MYLITNRNLCNEDRYFEVIKECIENKVENIIIREKDLDNNSFEILCKKIKLIRDKSNKVHTNLIVNSNVNIYEKENMDGIHLPFKVFLEFIHQGYEFDKNKILGISIHNLDEVKILEKLRNYIDINVSYIILSHIYETKCKENLKPKGLNFLKEARKITDIKIVALGGILPTNVRKTLEYCDDIAVMSTIMQSKDITKDINKY